MNDEMDEIRKRDKERHEAMEKIAKENTISNWNMFEKTYQNMTGKLMFDETIENLKKSMVWYNQSRHSTLSLSLPNVHAMIFSLTMVNTFFQLSRIPTPPIILSARDMMCSIREKLIKERNEIVEKSYAQNGICKEPPDTIS